MPKKLFYLFLLVLAIFNVFFTSAIAVRNMWGTRYFDDSRDILIGKHIVEFGEAVSRGPWSDGGTLANSELQLLHSPLYYWFIAILWYLQPGVENVTLLWTRVLAFGFPLLAFLVGSACVNKKTGLVLALLVIFNFNFVDFTIHVWQPHLALLFLFLSLYFFYDTYRKMTPFKAALTLFLLCLVPHFHLSPVIVVVVYILFLMHRIYAEYVLTANRQLLIVPGIALAAGAIFYLFFTYDQYFGDQFVFLFKSISNKALHSGLSIERGPLDTLQTSLKYISKLSWAMGRIWNVRLTVVGISAVFVFALYDKTMTGKLIKVTLAIMGLCIAMSYFLNNILHDSYLIPLVGVNMLLYACAVSYTFDFLTTILKSRFASYRSVKFWILLVASLAVMITTVKYIDFLHEKTFFSLLQTRSDVYGEMLLTAEAIQADRLALQNMSRQNYDSFTLASLFPYSGGYYNKDGWPTSSQWLILEELSTQQLVKITDSRNSGLQFRPLQENIETIYLTCLHTDKVNEEKIPDEKMSCTEMFLNSRPYLGRTYRTLVSNMRLSVFAFKKDQCTHQHIETDEMVVGSNYGT